MEEIDKNELSAEKKLIDELARILILVARQIAVSKKYDKQNENTDK